MQSTMGISDLKIQLDWIFFPNFFMSAMNTKYFWKIRNLHYDEKNWIWDLLLQRFQETRILIKKQLKNIKIGITPK